MNSRTPKLLQDAKTMIVGVDIFHHNSLLLFLKSPLEWSPSENIGIFQTLSYRIREEVGTDTERAKYPP